MMIHCPHGIEWKDCSRCHEEDLAEDLPTPDYFIHVYAYADEMYAIARAEGYDIPHPELSPVERGMNLWRERTARWYDFHDGHHDIGGET